MTIPHVAIVSSFLLAGNNPNILEGIIGLPTIEREPPLKWHFLVLTYQSRYRPASIWNRGRNKRIWAQKLSHHRTEAPEGLIKEVKMSKRDWFLIFIMASSLIVIPSTLAFLTSYYTPIIGLSCRSITFLCYMLCQLCLIGLWVWDIENTYVDRTGIPHMPVRSIPWKGYSIGRSWYACPWYLLTTINIIGATFTAIGGTMMQIIGVYRNCRCQILIKSWHNPDDVMFNISTNSAEDISYAKHYWTGTGAGAVSFLGFVAFVGWWYV